MTLEEYTNANIVEQGMGRLMKPNANPWDDKSQGYLKYVREGGEIFFQNCHFCHGDNLNGRGLHAFAFNPIPANFTDPGTIAQLQETFIFWRVAKGGIGLPNEGFPWASVMPPWEQHLTVAQFRLRATGQNRWHRNDECSRTIRAAGLAYSSR